MTSIENSTVEEIWQGIEKKLEIEKGPYTNINTIYEFQLPDATDSVYQLQLTNGTATIYTKNKQKADCILTMKVKDFKKFLLGELNSTTAFMTGKLKVSGNIGLALKLENMLKQYNFTD